MEMTVNKYHKIKEISKRWYVSHVQLIESGNFILNAYLLWD